MSRDHQSAYDDVTTGRCERALVTLLGDIGPWSERIYLVGGLAPRYIVGTLPAGAAPHVGTTDVDLVIGLALGDDSPETYRTLANNLKTSGFRGEMSFRWKRRVEGVTVTVEFLCETDEVEPGRIFRPRADAGSALGAFNVRGAQLVTRDYLYRTITAERLDGGGLSRVEVRVANILSYTVLKILAFQDRHENKDAYDLVYCLLNFGDGPEDAGLAGSRSLIRDEPQVRDALRMLGERFAAVTHDGPIAYGAFLARPEDGDETARLRQEAIAVVRAFLHGLDITSS